MPCMQHPIYPPSLDPKPQPPAPTIYPAADYDLPSLAYPPAAPAVADGLFLVTEPRGKENQTRILPQKMINLSPGARTSNI